MDFGQVRSDPDLELLRADSRFEVRPVATVIVGAHICCVMRLQHSTHSACQHCMLRLRWLIPCL